MHKSVKQPEQNERITTQHWLQRNKGREWKKGKYLFVSKSEAGILRQIFIV